MKGIGSLNAALLLLTGVIEKKRVQTFKICFFASGHELIIFAYQSDNNQINIISDAGNKVRVYNVKPLQNIKRTRFTDFYRKFVMTRNLQVQCFL